MKLAVISQDVLKVATISGFGLAVNALLGYSLLEQWGLLGVAVATGISGALSTIFLLLATRTQTWLGYGQMVSLALTWLAIVSLAVSFHFDDLSVAVVAGFGCAALVIFQIINIFDKVTLEDADNVLAS